ncbi:MAG TPA: hypothetical protein VFW44_13305 [Bryobacteraceae bacterium]|nr:hypothetical protein [Bryobacteraceae bacterium]
MRGLILLIFAAAVAACGQGVITTVAGNGGSSSGGDNGSALNASFHPNGVTVDSAGNIYIADVGGSRIRKVDAAGVITTVAGFAGEKNQFSGDNGPAVNASIYISSNHNGLAVDKAGNLYIADDGHNRIRKVDPNGIITTVAGNGHIDYSGDNGPATSASLWRPSGVAVDGAGNIYIADTENSRVRKVDTQGVISTLAGNGAIANTGDGGPAKDASLAYPMDVAVDAAGNVYIADQNAYVVRKVNPAGIISTIAGTGAFGFFGDGGPANKAEFASPYGIAVDKSGNLYIADFGNGRVRKVDGTGTITTVAGGGGAQAGSIGDGGPPTSANLKPAGVAVDAAGNYYIADFGHNRIRKVSIEAHVPGLLSSAHELAFSGTVGGNSPSTQVPTIYTTGSVPLHFSVSASTTSGGPWLNASVAGGLTPAELTVFVQNLPGAGSYKGNVQLKPDAPDLPVVNIPVTLNLTAVPPARPAITSVVNGASFQSPVGENSWATISGTNLASVTDSWSITNNELPTVLDGVTVTFDGKPAYISYVSPTQINVLVPNIHSTNITGVGLTNSGNKVNAVFDAPGGPVAPAFFTWPGNQVVATRQDYSYAVKSGTFASLTTAAAKPGDVLVLWGTGFGPTTPAALVGYLTPSDQTYSTSTLPKVTIDNVSAKVYGAALAPGFAGLYQVAIQVPETLGNGEWPLVATVGGVSSPGSLVLAVEK